MSFNEIRPKCGWLAYHRRQQIREKILTAAGCLVILAAYIIVGTIEYAG